MEQYGSIEAYYIARCLALAERGRGHTNPNPLVGAVVLDARGRKVGEGWHSRAGGPHAEIVALNEAGDNARGGTLFVNLEPCNHHGQTPPCTDRIIASGVDRVVCGTLDPNPLVSGSGRDKLQNARISVRYGFLEEACCRLNEMFFYAITHRRPFVTLKLAMTMDGKIATRTGQSRWITGEFSRQFVHHLRMSHDAVLTTAETVMADDPELTVRGVPQATRQPVRVVIDRRFRLNPERYRVFQTQNIPTWVFTSRIRHNETHARIARQRGVEVLTVDDTGLSLDMREVLQVLGERGLGSVFVEGGGRLAGSLFRQNLVNKLYLFYAPKLLPDASAIDSFNGAVNVALPGAPQLNIVQTRRLEDDLVIEAYPLDVPKPVPVVKNPEQLALLQELV